MATAKFIYDAKLDSTMQDYYVDVDEMRERVLPDGRTLPYRYVHGESGNIISNLYSVFHQKKNSRGDFSSICLHSLDRMKKWHLWTRPERMTKSRSVCSLEHIMWKAIWVQRQHLGKAQMKPYVIKQVQLQRNAPEKRQ